MSFVVTAFSSLGNVGCDARSLSLSRRSHAAFNAGSFFNRFASFPSSYHAITWYMRCLVSVSLSWSIYLQSRISLMQLAIPFTNPILSSACLINNSPASEVISPPSKSTHNLRFFKYENFNCFVIHFVIANFLSLVVFFSDNFNNTKDLRFVGYFIWNYLWIIWAKCIYGNCKSLFLYLFSKG